ncbi:hypothetical protein [Acinetobacter johnsonii]|uniref:hypothetical protein n=1 Tax=Acinetobacter johnsonii TaxID=40214 RepID=UPI00191B899E|nr:hypothetical protein [Acinetobacter johnsonii]QQT58362.1 hypothetical protein I6I50_01565 [Acinetobacter johnsonii]
MDCKVVLDSRKILVDRDELNFEANILPMSLFEEDVSSYRFRKIDLKYLSDDNTGDIHVIGNLIEYKLGGFHCEGESYNDLDVLCDDLFVVF